MMKKICILGLGYIGLPTAAMFATHGWEVLGVDTNPMVVDSLNQGEIRIEETGLLEVVQGAVRAGHLRASMTPQPADVFILAVPTPILPDKKADLSMVRAAAEAIVPHLKAGALVVLESTSPPGTTTDVVQPILEKSGLQGGHDFLLAYSPERVLPGKILEELIQNARVIGGINPASAQAGRELYQTFVQGDIVLTDAVTAEMVKLMENTFRDVNIALANEFALISEKLGVNVWEAIAIANRHPRVKILKPGPGVGGHCIAVDPWFLVEAAPKETRLIYQARQINDSMPDLVVERVKAALTDVSQPVVACLGLTFKPDVDDTRESPAVEVMERLTDCGFEVRAYDPHVPLEKFAHHLKGTLDQALQGADLVILLVDHSSFRNLTPSQFGSMRGKAIFDTRDALPSSRWQEQGFQVMRLGDPKVKPYDA